MPFSKELRPSSLWLAHNSHLIQELSQSHVSSLFSARPGFTIFKPIVMIEVVTQFSLLTKLWSKHYSVLSCCHGSTITVISVRTTRFQTESKIFDDQLSVHLRVDHTTSEQDQQIDKIWVQMLNLLKLILLLKSVFHLKHQLAISHQYGHGHDVDQLWLDTFGQQSWVFTCHGE